MRDKTLVALYGSGKAALTFLENHSESKTIDLIFDRKIRGKILGFDVHSVDNINKFELEKVIIASEFFKEISCELLKLGITEPQIKWYNYADDTVCDYDETLDLFKRKLEVRNTRFVKCLEASASYNIERLQTVCFALGPYRNLSTLTASTLYLHPDIQVLNHGGKLVFHDEQNDLFENFESSVVDSFLKFVSYLSNQKQKGDLGGQIVLSKKFSNNAIFSKYISQNPTILNKENSKVLFWKESALISEKLKKNLSFLKKMASERVQFKFILPVRNPMDCAISNLKTGHYLRFNNLGSESRKEDILNAILDELKWVLDMQLEYPNHFYVLFENRICPKTISNLSKFLNVTEVDSWVDLMSRAFVSNSRYDIDQTFIELYRELVKQKFISHHSCRNTLIDFVDYH